MNGRLYPFFGWGCVCLAVRFFIHAERRRHEWTSLPVFWVGCVFLAVRFFILMETP
jgi:hypothetical protein